MSKATSRPFDSADYIDTPEAVAAYLEAALEDGDAQIIAATLGDIARSKGMATIAERTGRALRARRSTTLLGVLKAMGLRLSVTTDSHQAARLARMTAIKRLRLSQSAL
jgi:probable addiction module antidote protein